MPWMMALVDSITSVIMDIFNWSLVLGLRSLVFGSLITAANLIRRTKYKDQRSKIVFLESFYTNRSGPSSLPATVTPNEFICEAVNFISVGGDLF